MHLTLKILLTSIVLMASQHAWCFDDRVYTTKFIIKKLPKTTPHDASIYLVTDIDGWFPDIDKRKFKRKGDGSLELTIIHTQDTVQYKITRGSWDAVEARRNGRARSNRVHIQAVNYAEVHLEVESWEDVSYHYYFIHMFFLIVAAIQGFLLLIAINTIRNKNKSANSALSALLILICLSLIGRASTFEPEIFNWQPKLIFLPELILFTYGPLFFFYIHQLLDISWNWKKSWVHLIPLALQLVIFLPYLVMDEQTLIYRVIDKELFKIFVSLGIAALIFNAAYWVLCRKLIRDYAARDHLSKNQLKYLSFLRSVLNIKAFYLCIWLVALLISPLGKAFNQNWLFVSENLIDILWLLFSFIIFALAYYAVKHPEVLREKIKYKDYKMPVDEMKLTLDRLMILLQQEKIFQKQDLNLESLAHKIPTNTHTLSRVINERFGQSFNDLINTYRVEHFVKTIQGSPKTSYLQAAHDAGFSSKATFNRVFKKIKGKTPRQYFKETETSTYGR